jgi:hypothetical protein
MRKVWTIAAVLAVALAALLGWAWYDGGEGEMRTISAPASLPQVQP